MRPVRSDLTAREWEVLDQLSAGKTTDQVADDLFLSVETVRSHTKSLYRKLGVHSRDELRDAVRALRTPPGEPE
jgi:two-component system nitrate/nitrite response regulator NarL